MKKFSTVFLTTIFPASQIYLDDFFNSLQKQSNKNFDVIIMNDGVKDFNSYILRFPDLNIIEKKVSGSFAKIREIGINTVKEYGYQNIIFGDSDDYFSENRVEESISALKFNHLVVNDLTIVSGENKEIDFLKNNLKNTNFRRDTILNGNVFGFSNISLRAEIINIEISFNDKLLAADWYFVTSLLLQKEYKIKFLGNVQTYYRQHSNNVIGISLYLTSDKLELGIRVKIIHYQNLIEFCKKNNNQEYYDCFVKKLNNIIELKNELSNEIFRQNYIDRVNRNIKNIFTGWWSEIITKEDLILYN